MTTNLLINNGEGKLILIVAVADNTCIVIVVSTMTVMDTEFGGHLCTSLMTILVNI